VVLGAGLSTSLLANDGDGACCPSRKRSGEEKEWKCRGRVVVCCKRSVVVAVEGKVAQLAGRRVNGVASWQQGIVWSAICSGEVKVVVVGRLWYQGRDGLSQMNVDRARKGVVGWTEEASCARI
jgi:hypothetical protein